MHNKYSTYLETLSYISDIEVWKTGDIKFNLTINKNVFPLLFFKLRDDELPCVFLCNPSKDDSQKPHSFNLVKNELIYLCLSIRKDISVRNKDYKQILDYTLTRVIRLLTLTPEEEKREFRKEFLYFWNHMSKNENNFELFLKPSVRVKKLKVYEKKQEITFVDPEIKLNEVFFSDYKKTETNVLYVPLINSSQIVPPLEEKMWDETTIKYILNTCVSDENIEILEQIKIFDGILFIVFEMSVPGILPITFVLKLNFKNKKTINIYTSVDNISSIEYISSQRFDVDYLFKRIGVEKKYSSKKVMVIGAGSLGSYILNELPKLGITNIGIVDDDELSIENIMRHSLGVRYINIGKAFGVGFDLKNKFPQLEIKPEKARFKMSDINKYNLEEYDVVVIATGGTDFMLSLNKYFHDNQFEKPVLYTWIEAKGIGVHSLLVDYNKRGCFQCLYTNVDKNKAHIGKEVFEYQGIGTGCGAVFNAYGNIVLLKGTAMILEIIDGILNGKYEDNLLFSIKTSNMYISEEYDKRRLELESGSNVYISRECEICGI